jgi:hypothetical protein
MFAKLNSQTFIKTYADSLIQRGFPSKDLDILAKELRKYPPGFDDKERSKKQVINMQKILPKLKRVVSQKMVLAPEYYRQFHLQVGFYTHYMIKNFWRNWGLTIMAELTPHSQRVLT